MSDLILLPCPFCSGESVTDFIDDLSYIIECNDCSCRTSCCDTREQAIEAWNRRAAPIAAQLDQEGCGRCPRDTPYGPATCGKCMEAEERLTAAQLDAELPPLPDGDEYSATRMLPNGELAPRFNSTTLRNYASSAVAPYAERIRLLERELEAARQVGKHLFDAVAAAPSPQENTNEN